MKNSQNVFYKTRHSDTWKTGKIIDNEIVDGVRMAVIRNEHDKRQIDKTPYTRISFEESVSSEF